MSAVLFRERTPAVDAIIDERRRLGIDRFDEVWEGVYVVNPAPRRSHNRVVHDIVAMLRPLAESHGFDVIGELNLGVPGDFRIPDVAVYRRELDDEGDDAFLDTAAIVVEVRSPGERVDKRPFYLAHGVAEVVLVDPATGTVEWLALTADGATYVAVSASAVLPVGPADVAALLPR